MDGTMVVAVEGVGNDDGGEQRVMGLSLNNRCQIWQGCAIIINYCNYLLN